MKGFTIVELIIIVAMLIIIAGGGYVLIHFICKYW